MIHISIPSHRTLTDPDDPFNKYTVFDIHVNGAFHASVRYNLLYSLHDRLITAFGDRLKAPEFPPKKVWKLDTKSLNERREGLAKYLQGVIANPDVARHIILEKAFLDFQMRSFATSVSRLVKLEVLLPDGRPVFVECCSDDPTNAVMEKLCRVLVMCEGNARYFGLFLARQRGEVDIDGQLAGGMASSSSPAVHFDLLCVRWLRNFESPFVSQQLANADGPRLPHKIVVHRVTWDPSVEEPLLDDPGSLKVLYLQALNDIQKGLLKLSHEVKSKLTALQEYGDFKQFVRLCQLQPEYGFEWLAPVKSDYPEESTLCQLKVGRRQLLLEHSDEKGVQGQSRLLSKRIRIWRVTHSESQPQLDMSFQLEYFVGGDEEFRLVQLQAEPAQVVLLSLFLQAIADEILHAQNRTDSPNSYKFDDNISIKAAESLEASRVNSVVADDLSIKSQLSANGGGGGLAGAGYQTNGHSKNGDLQPLKLISFQMPFLDNESFEDVTDADL